MKYRSIDTTGYEKIMERYNTGPLVAKAVKAMGYDEKDLNSFFMPVRYTRLHHDSFQKFADVLYDAVNSHQKVWVFGDYDCDGLCATAIMVKLLRKLNITNGFYVPNRFTEGYGLNLNRLKQAREKGYDILVTVDNGVSALEELKWAKESGMKTVVTDHHQINEPVDCDVLCHPSLLPEDYNYLCGASLAYLLADFMGLADDSMKVLAAVATLGDVMELRGYNVQLVREGIDLLNSHANGNILALAPDIRFPIDENEISFKIVPRINAIGRLADKANPNQAVKFLLSVNEKEIALFASQIIDLNNERKNMVTRQYPLVKKAVNENDDFLIVNVEGLHEGLLGLMASRLTDEYNKPCLIFTPSSEGLKGSGRSPSGIDIMEVLLGFKDRAITLGGHKGACGITIENDRYDELVSYVKDSFSGEKEAEKEVLEVNISDLSYDNIRELFEYKPYGQGRKIPLMKIRTSNIISYQMLKNESMLKWQLRYKNTDLAVLSFRNNEGFHYYMDKNELSFLGNLSENWFRGNVTYNLICEEVLD